MYKFLFKIYVQSNMVSQLMQNYNNNIYMYINLTQLSFKIPAIQPADHSPMGNLPHTGCDKWFLLITESNSPYRVWQMIPDDNQVKLTFHFVVRSKTHLVKYVKVPLILVLHHNTRLQQKRFLVNIKWISTPPILHQTYIKENQTSYHSPEQSVFPDN